MASQRFSIALCTHNGARFLQEQLDSLSRQTLRPAELVIGDDASTDATLEILTRFARRAEFTVRVIERPVALGHAGNFLATAKACTGDWVAFADQDDVWFDGKLSEVAGVIARFPQVLLVNQRALLCDEALTPRSLASFPLDKRPGLHSKAHRPLPLVWPGLLMTVRARLFHDFDSAARPVLPDGELIGHGRWTFLLAAALGDYYVTAGPSACYRRHPGALTGDYRASRTYAAGFRDRNRGAISAQADYAAVVKAYLERLADGAADDGSRTRLAAAVSGYQRAADALSARLACYRERSFADRFRTVFHAMRFGGYFGPRLHAGGFKALVKDALA